MTPRLKRLLARNRQLYRWAQLALSLARLVLRRPHEPDFAAFGKFGERPGPFLDVGANQGQSALAFRMFNRRSPILSIEPNPMHERDLRLMRRFVPRFDYRIIAAGERSGPATLPVPVFRGLPLTGEAALGFDPSRSSWWAELNLGPGAVHELSTTRVPVEVRRLDELRLRPAFVKVDVEGAELQVLGGLSETIAAWRPIFLVEDADATHAGVSEFFAARGYDAFHYDPAADRFDRPRDRSAQNLFYLPREVTVR